MKNEERIMETKDMDGLSNKENVSEKKIEGSVFVAGKEDKSIILRSAKGAQSTLDQFGVKESVEVKDASEKVKKQVEEKKYIRLKPEIEEKLKKFGVEIETEDGKKETKTAVDAIEGMDTWIKEGLTPEQRIDAFSKSKALMDKFMQEYDAKSPAGVELRRILSEEALGDKSQELFDLLQNKKVDVRRFAEIVGFKLDDSMVSKLEEMIKVLSFPVGEEGSVIGIAGPAPIGGVAGEGQAAPAPSEGGGILKTSETPGTPGGKSQGSGEGGKKKVIEEEEEKKKFDWYKYGNAFLFLLILYMGVQGWYARMVEQMAERAR